MAVVGGRTTSPEQLSLPELVTHLETVRHPRTRRFLEQLRQRLAEASAAAAAPALVEARQIREELERELVLHMHTEERLLFPYARSLHAASVDGRRTKRPAFHSARNPIEVLGREHEAVAFYLDRLVELTRTPSPVTHAVDELVSDLESHMGLERQVLFPRLVALEDEVLSD
jgi:iron-sulfur cluster repair protein YtfE (RIC family)